MGTKGMKWITDNADRICAWIWALSAACHFAMIMVYAFTMDLNKFPIYTLFSFWFFLISAPMAIFFALKKPLNS